MHDAVEVIGKNFVANQFDQGSVKSDIGPIIDYFFYVVGVLAFRGSNQGGQFCEFSLCVFNLLTGIKTGCFGF